MRRATVTCRVDSAQPHTTWSTPHHCRRNVAIEVAPKCLAFTQGDLPLSKAIFSAAVAESIRSLGTWTHLARV